MSQSLHVSRFPLQGTRLIEASAGTGKTYTLAALYVRLVLGHGDPQSRPPAALLPTDILVLTFTKAATAELRERIRQRLIDAAAMCRGQLPCDEVMADILADYQAHQYADCAALLSMAAEWMDEAAILTIHGWCQRMLSQHAFESGASFAEQLALDSDELLLQVARDYFRQFLYPVARELLTALGDVARKPQRLLRRVRPWLSASSELQTYMVDGQPLPPPQPPQALEQQVVAYQQRLTELQIQLRQQLDEGVLTLLDQAMAEGSLHKSSYKAEQWPADRAWLASLMYQQEPLDVADKALQKRLLQYSQSRLQEKTKKGAEAPRHPVFDTIEQLHLLIQQDSVDSYVVLHHAALWIAAEFNQRKQQRGELTYDDLLTRLYHALHGESGDSLAARIRQQYPVALVDEFQDTDPLQFAMFRRIYPQVDSQQQALILVGDPKQAIYGFRGADIHTYLQARELTQGRHYNLPRNYRSSAALVEAVNALFMQAEQQPRGAFGFAPQDGAEENPLPFVAVQSQGRSQQVYRAGKPLPAMNYWLLDDDPEQLKKGDYLSAMANACGDQIAQLLASDSSSTAVIGDKQQSRAVKPADMAILVQDRQQARLVREALAARGVRSVYLSEGENIFDSDEAQTLLALLQALLAIEQESLLRAALALPLLGFSDQQLQRWQEDELAWEALTEQLRGLRETWRRQGILPMLRALLDEFSLAQRWLMRSDGERILTNVLHLAELLQHESQQRDGQSGLLRWFAEQIAQPGSHEERILRLESDEQLVRVVTIHKSKGLQYNLVFIPFACSYRLPGKSQQGVYYREQARHFDVAVGDNSLQQVQHDAQLESRRLLYVALTRAVYSCWLGLACYAEGNAKYAKTELSAMGQLLALAARPTAAQLADALARLPWQRQPLPSTQPKLTLLDEAEPQPALTLASALVRERWWIASYSALRIADDGYTASQTPAPDSANEALLLDEREPVMVAEAEVLSMHGFPRGALAGTLLHDLLEYAWQFGFSWQSALSERLQQALQQRGWQQWQEIAEDWLVNVLSTPLQACQTNLTGLSQSVAEMEFWMQAQAVDVQRLDQLIQAHVWPGLARPALLPEQMNGMLKGFIDLTAVDAEQRYWVIDYKSNWLGASDADYDQEAMQRALLEARYDVQACLYMLALHRLLSNRLPDYQVQPERYLGGAIYWFLRSPQQGQYQLPISYQLLTQLDQLFRGESL
ncbi:exodeoxyribonuclease V subunit beta [Idiomarina xiamenensis]|uniref:RecBCD enzyme subunit RecB n=1 Tax=Idiomarina xiamenensis 10-D-4 TaxID=740709 RepID=K2KCN5_9GAMM|nr:exodeoxyribonuclease V subunit beta [Idiomarina xiamenensis]EKE84447.1 exodeoxyribonuclease V subunit beta [Idiomarina xiamenensis 10-D-4]